MEDMDWAEYWWSKITGPREIVASTINALRSNRSAMVVVPHDLPWRHEFRHAVRSDLEGVPGLEELIVEAIDVEDENASESDPGRFLLERYALREDRANYRTGGKETIQQYLLRKGVMRNRLVWIKGIGEGDPLRWVRFCERWAAESVSDGLFVIESVAGSPISGNGRLAVIKYDDLVSEYDVQLFNSLVIDDKGAGALSAAWKKYGAAISSHLCLADAEIAHEFIRMHAFRKDDPVQTVEKLAIAGAYARRGSGSHVLALYRAGDIPALRRRIWEGQVEVLFPIIERQRLYIVDEYREEFEREVENGLMQFDEQVTKADDIELGTMVFLCASGRIRIQSHEMRNKIHVLRDCRNLLAHRDVCSVEQASMLLDWATT